MKPYEFRLQDIIYSDADRAAFSNALYTWKAEYTGRFIVLDENTRYIKLLIEYKTDWCAAELWCYDKDGGPFPQQISLSSAELGAIAQWSTPLKRD